MEELITINTEKYMAPINEEYADLDCEKAYELYYDDKGHEPECVFCDECYKVDMEFFKEEAYNMSYYWIFTGTAGRWDGRYKYETKVFNVDTFFNTMSNGSIDDYVVKLYKNGSIDGKGIHHDGTNEYHLRALDTMYKSEIIDFIKEHVNPEEINNTLKEWYKKTLSQLNKEELIDFIVNNIDEDYSLKFAI